MSIQEKYDSFMKKLSLKIANSVKEIINQYENVDSISFCQDYESYWDDDGYSVRGIDLEVGNIIYNGNEIPFYDIDDEHHLNKVVTQFIDFIGDIDENILRSAFLEGYVIFDKNGLISYGDIEDSY